MNQKLGSSSVTLTRGLLLVAVVVQFIGVYRLAKSGLPALSIGSRVNEAAVMHDDSLCESPSLPRGAIHIVVAAYKYQELEGGIGFEKKQNYLLDLGLTNADVYWYRRMRPDVPLREESGPCGMLLHERYLPNTGRDASPFYNHILEVWDNPPKAIIFMHGHAAGAYHSSCDAIFARSAFVYRDLVHSFNKTPTSLQHMVTLNSPDNSRSGTLHFDPYNWYPWPNATQTEGMLDSSSWRHQRHGRRLLMKKNGEFCPDPNPCTLFRQRWEHLLGSLPQQSFYQFCCASFIVPWEHIRRFPREFYQDIHSNVMMDRSYDEQCKGRHCFEFVANAWFGDHEHLHSFQELREFYNNMDALIYGTAKSPTVKSDAIIVKRMTRCKMACPPNLYAKYIFWRKWRNTWRHFGFYLN